MAAFVSATTFLLLLLSPSLPLSSSSFFLSALATKEDTFRFIALVEVVDYDEDDDDEDLGWVVSIFLLRNSDNLCLIVSL